MKKISWILLSAVVLFASCGTSDYERNSDGLVYKIFRVGKGEKVTPKTYMKIHQRAEVGDSVIVSTFGKIPTYGFLDSLTAPTHEFLDILDEMNFGDSAIVIRSVDTLVKRGIMQYSPVFVKGGTIKVTVKVLEKFKDQETFDKARVAEFENYKKREAAELANYLADKGIKATQKAEGVFLVLEKEGTGEVADSGKNVTMRYHGTLMNGKAFDSNIDSAFGHTDPFEFTLGTRQVIEGWDIGLKGLKTGAKGKLYLASMVAYGMQGGGSIPPYANLIFDVEVLKVGAPQQQQAAEAHHPGDGHDH